MDPNRDNAGPGVKRKNPSIEQLRGCPERYQKLFEQSGDGIFLHDLEGILLDVNDRGAQMLEFSREELIGTPLYALHPPEDLAEAHAAFARLLEEGFVRFRTRFTTGTGRILNVDAATAIVETAEFSVCQVVVRDITARVQAERALEERNLFIESLLQAVPVAVFFKDREGRYLGCNQVFTETMGVSQDAIAGKTVFELWPSEHAAVYHGHDLELMRERRHQTYEFEVKDKAGRIRPVIYAKNVFYDSAGEVAGLVGAFLDITEVRQAEEHLRLFKLSVENSSDAVGMSTPEGRHYYQNRAFDELFGDVGEDPPSSLYLDTAVGREVFDTIMAGGQWTGEVEMRARDGRVLTVLLRAYASRGPGGRIEALVGVHTDITARKRLEQERRELDARLNQMQRLQSLGVLAGGIAHDFNNILMAILGHSELVLEDLAPSAPARESVQEIRTAALGAAELCAQMLAYSGRGRLEKRDFCLGHLVEELVHMLRASVSKKCTLRLDIEKPLPLMRGDPSQLRQVILNLVINASEAIGDAEGDISVTTGVMDGQADPLARGCVVAASAPGPYVFVEVSDTGCGMSDDTIQRMFEPFFTTKFTGRGLGLSAVLGIVQAHGGALRVQSAPGRGTTIRVLFPALGQPATVETPGADAPVRTGRGTVLVVDDEASVLGVTCKMLSRLGYELLTAKDGQEAVALYRERGAGISLVLLDLTMPRMNGEEAFVQLRRINPQVRVVLASGYDEHDLAARFEGRGLAGCIQKPYTMQKLAAVLGPLVQGGP